MFLLISSIVGCTPYIQCRPSLAPIIMEINKPDSDKLIGAVVGLKCDY